MKAVTYNIEDLVSRAGEVLVDQVEWIPAEEDVFVVHLALAVGREGFVHEQSNIKVDCRFKTFLLHPLTAVAARGETLVTAYFAEILDYLGTDEVALTRVGKNADVLRTRAEIPLLETVHF